MARKARFHIGDSHAGFTLVEAATNVVGGNSNIRCKLTCDTCGSLQIGWKANWYSGKLTCTNCGRIKRENEVHRLQPYAVYDPKLETFTISWNSKPRDLPEGHKLFKFKNGDTAVAYTSADEVKILGDITVNPDAGHTHAFPMPQRWVDYWITGVKCHDHEEAGHHLESLVSFDYQPSFSSGSGTSWKVEGVTYAYLYVDL